MFILQTFFCSVSIDSLSTNHLYFWTASFQTDQSRTRNSSRVMNMPDHDQGAPTKYTTCFSNRFDSTDAFNAECTFHPVSKLCTAFDRLRNYSSICLDYVGFCEVAFADELKSESLCR
jgi:hypothetical protein